MKTINLTKKYETYPEYKDSGVEWLGMIPKDWKIVSSRQLFTTEKERVGTNFADHKILSLTLQGIIPRVLDGSGKNPAEYDTYQKFKKEDLVFCLFDYDVTPRTIGYVEEDGMMTGAYTRLIPRSEIYSKYFYYYFLSLDFNKELLHLCTGLRNSLSKPVFWSMKSSLPSFHAQEEIVKYLDKKTTSIDQIIEKKQKLIELLREKRTAVINHAVTKGLDPKAELVESGVDWIGKIPKGWKVKKLKFLGEAIIGLTYSPEEVIDETGTLVLRSSNVQHDKITLDDNVYVDKIIPTKLVTRAGDILICSRNGSRSLIGKNAIIDEDSSGVSFGAFMTVFRTKHSRFISCFLKSNLFMSQLSTTLTSTINQLTTHYLNNIVTAVPPESEQEEIALYLDKRVNGYDKAVEYVEKSIEKLKEFKFSLISNVVTGKIKV